MAEGDLPTPGYDMDNRAEPDADLPAALQRDGQDDVEIEGCGEDLAGFAATVGDRHTEADGSTAREATGMARNLSFDEAFADASCRHPPRSTRIS